MHLCHLRTSLKISVPVHNGLLLRGHSRTASSTSSCSWNRRRRIVASWLSKLSSSTPAIEVLCQPVRTSAWMSFPPFSNSAPFINKLHSQHASNNHLTQWMVRIIGGGGGGGCTFHPQKTVLRINIFEAPSFFHMSLSAHTSLSYELTLACYRYKCYLLPKIKCFLNAKFTSHDTLRIEHASCA
jgi:hypothetical protein